MLNKNSARMLEELAEALNVGKSIGKTVSDCLQWERFETKTNEFYMNCMNWLFKIV